MESWSALEESEPDIARYGRSIFTRYGIAYLATVRADGGPRVHPVTPAIIDGHVILTIVPATPKLDDLRRDGRYMLHSAPGPNSAEFMIRGRAIEITDPVAAEEFRRRSSAEAIITKSDDAVFELLIEQADSIVYEKAVSSGPRAVRYRWPHERSSLSSA